MNSGHRSSGSSSITASSDTKIYCGFAAPASPRPEDAAALTFDDGYAEHFQTVFPILYEISLPALFFPPAQAILERQLLDVNKIHVLLSKVADISVLVTGVRLGLSKRSDKELLSFHEYWNRYAQASRFHDAPTIFVKRMLQVALPNPCRTEILNELFETYGGEKESVVANEFYVTLDQLKTIVRSGMYVGSHGYAHRWLDSLPEAEQALEVDRALEFLRNIGAPVADWIMCYPYGATNDSLVRILRSRGCAFALTTVVGPTADLASDPYRLPRMDTNDFPKVLHATAAQ